MAGRSTMRHSEEWWAMLAPPAAVRCEGHTQDGHRCRREAISGGTVCRQHGGAAGHVRAAAAARIGNAADEMAKKLIEWANDPNVEMRDKIKIAQDLLDRNNLTGTNKVLLGHVEVDPVERLFRELLSDPDALAPPEPQPAAMDAQVMEWNRTADPQALAEDDVVEAELVEDGEDLLGEPEAVSTAPPAHIRRDLERLDKMLDGRWR